MILCIDAGNSRIKWGLAAAASGGWKATGAVPTAIPPGFDPAPAKAAGAVSALACSVAGAAVEAALADRLRAEGIRLSWLRSAASAFGVTNGYRNPAQLGADRWAALIAARGLHDGPAVVVMAGTATTVDLLSADGRFLGGYILPGFDLMRAALARNTAQLPLADAPATDIPRTTDEAIVGGCLAAQAGAVERMFRHIAREAGARCLLSGGAAAQLAPALDLPLTRFDNLVLEGLRRVAFAGPDSGNDG